MTIDSLAIRSFRNLSRIEIEPSPRINLVFGDNAAGKTSLLEAIYYLGRGRSFRTQRHDRVVCNGETAFRLVARLARSGSAPCVLGMERGRGLHRLRYDGRNLSSTAELARILPLQLIHPNSHRLLEEGPKYRRQFLDWGVFHVEHHFFPAWQRFQRALQQRNMALRKPGQAVDTAWDRELVTAAEIIDRARRAYLADLQACLPRYLQPLAGEVEVEIAYQCGWDADRGLAEALANSLEIDRRRGHTTQGPQRADVVFRIDGVPATERLSRGQQKLFVSALLLAQVGALTERIGEACLVLIDDLAAELDTAHREALVRVLGEMDTQAFVTVIDPEPFLPLLGEKDAMFHVEHGQLKKVV